MTRSLVLLLAGLLLAGCVSIEDESAAFTVYLPAVAHDCTPIICGEVERLAALIACEQEMVRLRNEGERVQMPDDCAEFRAPDDPDFRETLKPDIP